MDKKTFFIALLSVFILVSIAFNSALVYIIVKNQKIWEQKQVNLKVLSFRNMFTEKILLADKEIDFDTRLSLETSVRNIDDPEIFAQWQRFAKSETKEEATTTAKQLLELLIKKTSK